MLKKSLRPILCIILLGIATGYAQNDILTPHNIFNVRNVVETAVSPDGNYVAYIATFPRPFSDASGSDYRELHVLTVATGETRPFITGKKSLGSINWTPDSKRITFLARFDDAAATQIYTMNIDGGAPSPLTDAKTGVIAYEFNPDGKVIAYTATDSPDPKKASLAAKGFNQEIYEEEFQHINLYLFNLSSNKATQLTSGVTVFDFAWSPDGKTIAAAISEKNLVDYSYMFKRLRLIDASSGTITNLVDNPGKLGPFSWSQDGKYLAFVSAVDVHDSKEGSIFVAPVPNTKKFSDLKNYSLGFRGTVVTVKWKDKNTLLFVSEEGVDMTLREQKLNEDKSAILIQPGAFSIRGFSARNGLVSLAGRAPLHPSELFTYNLKDGKLQRRTTLNPWLDKIRLAKQERFAYQAKDGLEIEGVLIYPLNYEKGKRYPLIVDIHGGPEACYQNDWITNYGNWGQVAAARGYFVFMPNYRASTGRGVEFAKMGFGDLAGKEFEDVLDGIDRLVQLGYVDKDKVGIGGGSYGGYFSAWAATKHSDQFAAAVVFVGVANQISKRNTTDIPWEDYFVHWGIWTHEDHEKVYDRSPVKWATNSKTPTLILHGKEDPRIHPSQGLELYRSLKMHGKAPVRLVFYPGEGHGNRRNPARLDFLLRTMDWFDYYLKSDKPKDQLPAAELEYMLESK